jgi:hypothetical protein
MRRISLFSAFVLTASVAAAGCGRDEAKPAVPPAEVQTQAVQPANQPTTINGCLKAGDAQGMYVVTAAQTAGSPDTATYQLVGNTGVNLADHIGRRVQVSGIVRETGELESRARAETAKPEATSGTAKPVVETKTEVKIKRLEVSSVQPTGDRCE